MKVLFSTKGEDLVISKSREGLHLIFQKTDRLDRVTIKSYPRRIVWSLKMAEEGFCQGFVVHDQSVPIKWFVNGEFRPTVDGRVDMLIKITTYPCGKPEPCDTVYVVTVSDEEATEIQNIIKGYWVE